MASKLDLHVSIGKIAEELSGRPRADQEYILNAIREMVEDQGLPFVPFNGPDKRPPAPDKFQMQPGDIEFVTPEPPDENIAPCSQDSEKKATPPALDFPDFAEPDGPEFTEPPDETSGDDKSPFEGATKKRTPPVNEDWDPGYKSLIDFN